MDVKINKYVSRMSMGKKCAMKNTATHAHRHKKAVQIPKIFLGKYTVKKRADFAGNCPINQTTG